MINKSLRILVLFLYFGIPLDGEHIGGSLITLLLFALFDGSVLTLGAILIFLTAAILLLTVFKTDPGRDKFLVPIGLTILLVPLIKQIIYLIEYSRWVNEVSFIITCGVFVTLSGHWIATILKTHNTNTAISHGRSNM